MHTHTHTRRHRHWISRENTRCVPLIIHRIFRNANFRIHDGKLYLLMALFCCLTRFLNVIPWRYLLSCKLLLWNVLKLYSFDTDISSHYAHISFLLFYWQCMYGMGIRSWIHHSLLVYHNSETFWMAFSLKCFCFSFYVIANRIARGARKKISPLWLTFWMLTRFIYNTYIYGYISMHQESTEFSGQYLMEWEIPDTDCRLNSIDVMRFMVAS